jgi:hypothetical protein
MSDENSMRNPCEQQFPSTLHGQGVQLPLQGRKMAEHKDFQLCCQGILLN